VLLALAPPPADIQLNPANVFVSLGFIVNAIPPLASSYVENAYPIDALVLE
jgi:hypothetical protein